MEEKTKYPGIYRVNGGYRVRVYGHNPKNGKKKEVDRVLKGVSLSEAVRQHAELREEIARGGVTNAPQTTLTAYVQSWLERRSGHYKVSTLKGKVTALEQHILPFLGDIFLDQLRQGDLESWMRLLSRRHNRRQKQYAPGTVNYAWRVLRSILKDAVVELDLSRDPTVRVRSLPATPPDQNNPNVLLFNEVPRFLEVMRSLYPHHHAFVFLGLTTGMRFGELSALTWQDIDETENAIRVSKAQTRGVVSTTKTGTVRTIPLTEEMKQVLVEHRRDLIRRQNPGLGSGLVFPADDGGFRSQSFLAKPFARVCQEIGINRRFTVHGMRRTYNTLMLRAGVDHLVLRATIGHSSEAMTEHYSFISLDAKREGAQRLMALLGDHEKSSMVTEKIDSVGDHRGSERGSAGLA